MIDRFLTRLEMVRQTGDGKWMAKCPAHDDTTPSLSIRLTHDNTILIHDFGLCPTPDVLAAIGLSLSDLFEKPLAHRIKPTRPYRQRSPVVERAALLGSIIALAASDLKRGEPLSDFDQEILEAALYEIGRLT